MSAIALMVGSAQTQLITGFKTLGKWIIEIRCRNTDCCSRLWGWVWTAGILQFLCGGCLNHISEMQAVTLVPETLSFLKVSPPSSNPHPSSASPDYFSFFFSLSALPLNKRFWTKNARISLSKDMSVLLPWISFVVGSIVFILRKTCLCNNMGRGSE